MNEENHINNVTLPQDLCDIVNYSMMTGMPMLVTYWDHDGFGCTSWRGSTHVHSYGRLALWIRSRQGGLQKAIQTRPRVTLAYRNPHSDAFVTFTGLAYLETTDEGNRRIYDESPPMERSADPGRRGIGMTVILERVTGRVGNEVIALG